MKNVLAFAAVAEASTGLLLVLSPSIVVRLLFGAEISGAAIAVSRIAGVSLAWLGRRTRLTSPRDATGFFELQQQPRETLLPFEGIGVDTSWELRMPRASNQFDYRSIADVLFTIDFTALPDLRKRHAEHAKLLLTIPDIGKL